MRLGIIGAMDVEVSHLRGLVEGANARVVSGMEFVEGTLSGIPVVVVRSGIGKVSAALCMQTLACVFGVTHVVNTGVAGSLDDRLDVGDVLVSHDAVHYDVDARVFGYAPGEVPQLGTKAFEADRTLVEAALRAAALVAPDITCVEGRVASGDRFVCDVESKRAIAQGFHASCCEMEGAAIAQVAWQNHIPFVIVRTISDKADGSDVGDYLQSEERQAGVCAAIVARMVGLLA